MIKQLKNIAEITMGQSPKSIFYNDNEDGLPFLQGCTTFGYINPSYNIWTSKWSKEAKVGDVLFTVRAPVGIVNISRCKVAIGRGIAALHPINVSSKYLFYLIGSNVDRFKAISSGTIYDSINYGALCSVELDVHSPEMQQHIVDTI